MSAAHEEYEDLHRLVDRLTPTQAQAVRAVVLQLVPAEETPETPPPLEGGRRRRLSFAGLISDEPDLAKRSEDIIRERFRQS